MKVCSGLNWFTVRSSGWFLWTGNGTFLTSQTNIQFSNKMLRHGLELNVWSRRFSGEANVRQLLKTFHALYGPTVVFTIARHRSLA